MSRTKDSREFSIQCRILCFCREDSDTKPSWDTFKYKGSSIWRWGFLIVVLVILQFYYNTSFYYDPEKESPTIKYLRHSLPDTTTLERFMARKSHMQRMGLEEEPVYAPNISVCSLNLSTLGPTTVNKTQLQLQWAERQHPEVAAGGFHAPQHCRPRHKVAILVPYRSRETNLAIFLYHIHPFLQKQLLQYRVFVIEQYGYVRKFNKGSLYNAGYLETQRFGEWHCLVFHDVDLLPLDQRILYSCPRMPTHMSPAVEQQGYQLPYRQLFGGVTVMTPAQYRAVNGYSNSYWDWGAEDDDMYIRLQARRFRMLRYNQSIARYASLPHPANAVNYNRKELLKTARHRNFDEGLTSIEYKLLNITKRTLFTHILINVNPYYTTIE